MTGGVREGAQRVSCGLLEYGEGHLLYLAGKGDLLANYALGPADLTPGFGFLSPPPPQVLGFYMSLTVEGVRQLLWLLLTRQPIDLLMFVGTAFTIYPNVYGFFMAFNYINDRFYLMWNTQVCDWLRAGEEDSLSSKILMAIPQLIDVLQRDRARVRVLLLPPHVRGE